MVLFSLLQDYRWPIVYDYSIPLILPGQFYFLVILRAALFHVLWQYILWERIGSSLDQYQHHSYLSIERLLAISAIDGGHDAWSLDLYVVYRPYLQIIRATSIPSNFPNSKAFLTKVFFLLFMPSFFHFLSFILLLRLVILVSIVTEPALAIINSLLWLLRNSC